MALLLMQVILTLNTKGHFLRTNFMAYVSFETDFNAQESLWAILGVKMNGNNRYEIEWNMGEAHGKRTVYNAK